MIKLKHSGFIIWLFWSVNIALAQVKTLTIEACYERAKQNYPLIKKHELIVKTSGFSIENVGKLYLPQFVVSGQATYQSQTINFAEALTFAPGISLPSISKDQYKIQGEVNQLIFDGGAIKNQQENIAANRAIQQQNLEVNLYALRDRITQLYFSILLINEQLKQNALVKDNLQSTADKAAAALQNGTSLRSNVEELQAEIANTEMTAIESRANRKAFLAMLSLFINETLDENTQLVVPFPPLSDSAIKRPELTLFDLKKRTYDIQEKQLQTDYLPKLNAFMQGAYGRPTLNIIENKFGTWWIAGIRLNWNLGSLYTLKNNRNLLKINRETVDVDRETFLYNTNLTLTQQNSEVQKYRALLQQDEAIISLRASVVKSAQAQLDNGVITVHEYITKINAENLAQQSQILHHTQLLQAQYNYKNTAGN